MTVHQILKNALDGMAPKVGRYPLDSRPDTYIAWFGLKSTPERASNQIIRVRHLMQVDIYSRAPIDDLLAAVLLRLKKAGCSIVDWGPETYETESRYRHVAITLRLATDEME